MKKQTSPDSGSARSKNIRHITLMAVLFSTAFVLSVVESYIPMPQFPGVKLGLANIVVMYALFFTSKTDTLLIVVLKSAFAFLTRGLISGIVSFSGGCMSIIIMILLIWIFGDKISYLFVSISGAIFHNIGQLIAASILMSTFLWAYLPILLISGVVTGAITSVILKITLPVIKNIKYK